MQQTRIDRRTALRQATREQHATLDDLASRLDLRRRIHYCQYLLASAGPIIGLELALESSGVEALFSDWPRRRRRFALAQDLHALALIATPCDAKRDLSPAAMFGILYVLEGSRLGAQILLARANQSADESVLCARQYLRTNDPALWLGYLRVLDAAPDETDHDEMIDAACHTFGLFTQAFAECAQMPRHGAA